MEKIEKNKPAKKKASVEKKTPVKVVKPKKVKAVEVAIVKPNPVKANQVYDSGGKLIGTYLYLHDGDQEVFDSFMRSFLKTAEQDENFFLVIDLETTGLDPKQGDILLHSISWNGTQSIIFEHQRFDCTLYKEVLSRVPIGNQNLIGFDAKWIREHFGILVDIFWDTQVCAQIGWAGEFPSDKASFGLGNLLDKIFNGEYKVEKETRKEFIGKKLLTPFTKEQIEYAVLDSLLTYKLIEPQYIRLLNHDLLWVWEEIEKPFGSIMVDIMLTGIRVDVEELDKYIDEAEASLYKLDKEFNSIIDKMAVKPPLPKSSKKYNPNSSTQIPNILNSVGIFVKDTKADTLLEAQVKGSHRLLDIIIEFKKTKDNITKQLLKWQSGINKKTGKIYPTYRTHGASSGRLSAADPPVHGTRAEHRRMVIADPGCVLVGVDYQAYELIAYIGLAGEKKLIEAIKIRKELSRKLLSKATALGFNDADDLAKAIIQPKAGDAIPMVTKEEADDLMTIFTSDPHRINASLMFGIKTHEVDKASRTISKCVALDTLVHLKTGIVTVGSLLPKTRKADTFYDLKGVKVLTDIGYEDVDRVYYKGKCKGFKISTSNGINITCSDVHKWRSIDKKGKYCWKTTKSLVPGDIVFTKMGVEPTPKKRSIPLLKSDEGSELLVDIIASYLKKGLIEEDKIFFGSDVTGLIKDLSKHVNTKPVSVRSSGKKEYSTVVNWQDLIKVLTEFRSGIPDWLMNGDSKNLARFIKSTSSCYGSIYRWEFDSKALLGHIQNVLTTWGIMSFRYPASVNVNSIPFVSISTRRNVILESRFNGKKKNWKESEIIEYKLCSTPAWHRKLSELTLFKDSVNLDDIKETLGSDYDTAKFLVDNGLHRVEIVSVTPVGLVEMCDLSVPTTNTIVYEGLVSHNTTGYCVVPETRVLTKKLEWKPAKDLVKGELLWAFDENHNDSKHPREISRKWRSSEIEETGRITLPCKKLTFSDGTSVTSSTDHKWLVMGSPSDPHLEWQVTNNIKLGCAFPMYVDFPNEENSWENGYIGGLLDGEGSTSNSRIFFAQNPGKVLDNFTSFLNKFNYAYGEDNKKDCNCIGINVTGKLHKKMNLLIQTKPQRIIDNYSIEGRTLQKFDYKTVTKIEDVGLKEVIILQTSTRTFIAEGLGSHNCTLYDGQADRVQKSLAEEGLFYTRDQCQDFQNKFYERLPLIKKLKDDTQARVKDGGFVKAFCGRKLFFKLPPKFMTYRYETEHSGYCRQAANFIAQCPNAHALKLSIIRLSRLWDNKFSEEDRPDIIINMHDELVTQCKKHLANEVLDDMVSIMEEAGMEALGNVVEISCSATISEHWQK